MGCACSRATEGTKESGSIYGSGVFPEAGKAPQMFDSGELRPLGSGQTAKKAAGAGKVPERSSLLGRAGIAGLEKAVEVLDTLGSSVSNLNLSSGFASGMTVRGHRISILAFEVANTIAKGAGLLQSLSEENIRFLKNDILKSEGVQQLVSSDMNVLLRIAAFDKREEVDLFSAEVARFGDQCKDPIWHNLGRFFQKLDSQPISMTHRQRSDEVVAAMEQLKDLAQNTSELYHELHALDRFEQDYQRKVQEEGSSHAQRGESIMILRSELKHQRKFIRSLKKKSLWSRHLEEVVEKLVDVVTFLYQQILEAFGSNGTKSVHQSRIHNAHALGISGLALHYANTINQIDAIVSRPSSIPPNTRDALYRGLPTGVKAAMRFRIQSFQNKEELTIPHIKAEMEKTLHWIVPMAESTTRAHQGFGWVGEWANSSVELNKKQIPNSVIRIETLYHADKEKTDEIILELVTWLHLLVSQIRNKGHYKFNAPIRSPTRKESLLPQNTPLESSKKTNSYTKMSLLSQEDRDMLEEVISRKLVPGISKSQELTYHKKRTKRELGRSRSGGSSPAREFSAAVDLKHRWINALDIMDGLDMIDGFRTI
ncbi:hypothetical protein QJS10_CPA01g00420 [Acorus calamus]|uniref:Uncharacterized protein n=1 Tax=Acorus calamus TaxID=4465 RepID=A0AAV9FF57_ACOCL|nr:hypothetical protein QJS10_CPA01g00420 [Acorus calamus]